MMMSSKLLSCNTLLPCSPLLPKLCRSLSLSSACLAKRWRTKTELPFASELRNPAAAALGVDPEMKPGLGRVVDKRPVRVRVKKYHVYKWCGCGMSMTQPFCDLSHRNKLIKNLVQAGPVTYIAPEDGEVWFCNCKQTAHRPFCDGTHRGQAVQEASVDGKFELWEPRDLEKQDDSKR